MRPNNPLKLDGARPLSDQAINALGHLGASRRDLLKTAGVLMIGFGSAAATGKAQNINPSGNVDNTQVDSWVAIGADGSITVLAGTCDFGQGLRTIQLQLAAEELFVPMDRITLVLCKDRHHSQPGLHRGQLLDLDSVRRRRSSRGPRYGARRVVSAGVAVP